MTRHEYHAARRAARNLGLKDATKGSPKAFRVLRTLANQSHDPLAWRAMLALSERQPLIYRLQHTTPIDVFYRWRQRCADRRAFFRSMR